MDIYRPHFICIWLGFKRSVLVLYSYIYFIYPKIFFFLLKFSWNHQFIDAEYSIKNRRRDNGEFQLPKAISTAQTFIPL